MTASKKNARGVGSIECFHLTRLQSHSCSSLDFIIIRSGRDPVQQLPDQMMVHEEHEVDSATREEARGEESSYEDAHEGLCWQREECSWRTYSLWNCFRIKLRVLEGAIKTYSSGQDWRDLKSHGVFAFLCRLARTKMPRLEPVLFHLQF